MLFYLGFSTVVVHSSSSLLRLGDVFCLGFSTVVVRSSLLLPYMSCFVLCLGFSTVVVHPYLLFSDAIRSVFLFGVFRGGGAF
jgi:hypothetical protein